MTREGRRDGAERNRGAERENERGFRLFIALYSFRASFGAARIWHDGRHYYGKPTDGASFIIFKFIVLPWPINSSSLEIGTARSDLAYTSALHAPVLSF